MLAQGVYPSGESALVYTNDTESITDIVGEQAEVNSCDHTKFVVTGEGIREFPYVCVLQSTKNPACRVRIEHYIDVCNRMVSESLRNGYGAPVADASALALSRVPNMSSEVMRCVVSIVELKDFKQILTSFIRGITGLKRSSQRIMYDMDGRSFQKVLAREASGLRKKLQKWYDRKVDITPFGFLQFLIGTDLGWKFAYAPLISDVNTLQSEYGRWQARVDRLAEQAFTVRGSANGKSDTHWSYAVGSPVGHPWCSIFEEATCTINTTKKWVFGVTKRLIPGNIPSIDALRWAEARERLGLNLRVSDAWQEVPLSFVFDWFIPVKDFLDQFVVPDRKVTGWFTETGAWSSEKTIQVHEARSLTRYQTTPGSQHEGMARVVSERGYSASARATKHTYKRTRLDTLPGIAEVPLYIPDSRLPSLGQSATGMELMIQRLLSPRVRGPSGANAQI